MRLSRRIYAQEKWHGCDLLAWKLYRHRLYDKLSPRCRLQSPNKPNCLRLFWLRIILRQAQWTILYLWSGNYLSPRKRTRIFSHKHHTLRVKCRQRTKHIHGSSEALSDRRIDNPQRIRKWLENHLGFLKGIFEKDEFQRFFSKRRIHPKS